MCLLALDVNLAVKDERRWNLIVFSKKKKKKKKDEKKKIILIIETIPVLSNLVKDNGFLLVELYQWPTT